MSDSPLIPLRPIVVDGLYAVHYFEYASGYASAGDAHDFWELLYVDKGSLWVTAGKKRLALRDGQAIFHAPGQFHALSAAGGTAPDLVVVGFSSPSPAMKFFRNRTVQVGMEERALLGRIVEESATAFENPLNDPSSTALIRRADAPFGGEQRIASALEELLLRLIRTQNGTDSHESEDTNSPDAQWLRGMEHYLICHLDSQLTIEKICRDNLVGRSQLQKRFHQLTGGGVMAYFTKLKMKAARRLIREGELNVTQIAARLGYQSVHYFSRQFKQQTGMAPSEYARSVKMFSGLPGTNTDNRTNNV